MGGPAGGGLAGGGGGSRLGGFRGGGFRRAGFGRFGSVLRAVLGLRGQRTTQRLIRVLRRLRHESSWVRAWTVR